MPAFVLQIQDLDESGKDWSFAVGKDWLASALGDTELRPGAKDGQLDVHAQRNGSDVLVQGRIATTLAATCARCLEEVDFPVDLEVATLYSPDRDRATGVDHVDVRLEDLHRDYYGGAQIELDSMIREHLLLEAPMKPLCSEGCEGFAVPPHLRPPEEVFGEAAPDARFAPLMKLKEKMLKNEE